METLKDYNLQDNLKLSTLGFENEDDWDELRRKGIGGSDIGAIMGLSPYSSPLKVYKQKVEDLKEDLSNNPSVRRGKDLENIILTNYVKPMLKTKGYEVGKPDFMIINEDYPYFRANVDGIAYKPGTSYKENIIIEIKSVSFFGDVNWDKPEYKGVPAYYYAQVQHYMLVTGAEKAIICALFDKDWTVHYYEIPKDETFIADMVEVGRKFYQYHMLMSIPPAAKYDVDKEEVTAAIKHMPENLVPSSKMTELIDIYMSNKEKIKNAEVIQQRVYDQIFDLYSKGYCPDTKEHSVKSSIVTSRRFNSARFKEDNPEIYEQYCDESESPRFTIK